MTLSKTQRDFLDRIAHRSERPPFTGSIGSGSSVSGWYRTAESLVNKGLITLDHNGDVYRAHITSKGLKLVGGEDRNMRANPSLVILGNPSGMSETKRAWSTFHLRNGSQASVSQIPDIHGVPNSVMVLGAFEGGEFADSRTWGDEKELVQGTRDIKNGPWLVCDGKMKRLWVVAKKYSDLKMYRRLDGSYMVAIYYYPGNPKSGKYHRTMAYRHAFGEFWADEKPQPKWAKRWPLVKFVGSRAIAIKSAPAGTYTIEEDGIVG